MTGAPVRFAPLIPLAGGAGYLPGLDGLRAISILIVLVAHLGLEAVVPGGLGVTVFFFVSGFLITRLLVGEQNAQGGAIDLKSFYIRRFLRLMPALFVFILVVAGVMTAIGAPPSGRELFAAAFYLVNYVDVLDAMLGWTQSTGPWSHLWSLAVEEHFYLLFPAALALFGRTHAARLRLILATIVGCAIWRVVAIHALGLPSEWTYQATDSRIESIAWGCLLAVMMDGAGHGRPARILHGLVGWHWIGLGLAAVLVSLLLRDEAFRATWRYSLQGAALFVLVLNLYALSTARFAIDLLELAPFRHLGRLSYSLYLWHVPVIWLGKRVEGVAWDGHLSAPMIAAAALGSLGLAMASHHLVERPFFALRTRFGGHPVETLAPAGKSDPGAVAAPLNRS
jgi:peptidoglycan/LPS O-acetylase OafA/YrhL